MKKEASTISRCAATAAFFWRRNFTEVFDSSTPYLWAIAADSKGNLYTAGGGSGSGSAKLFAIDAAGKSRTFAELEGLEIHAIALDSSDQVYAATDPDGKVYKIGAGRQAAGLLRSASEIYLGHGLQQQRRSFRRHRRSRRDSSRHAATARARCFSRPRRLTRGRWPSTREDNLIVGTEPGGLILRVSPSGQGFVLYQAPKREITAVAVAKDGAIYAAGVGNKTRHRSPRPLPRRRRASPVTRRHWPGLAMAADSAARQPSAYFRHRRSCHLRRI